jgi:putative transposase
MDNHYHFVLHTRQANLSRLMRHVNGVYTQAFNRRHGKVGHLFQGRFKAILVDREAYLLEVCRYVELNPVRAGMVSDPAAWPWSSYLAHVMKAPTPQWLDIDGLHGYMLARTAVTAADHRQAARCYAALVASAPDVALWDQALRQQIYLGDEAFAERMQAKATVQRKQSVEVPKVQRRSARTLKQWMQTCDTREQALHCAYTQGGLSMSEMA